MTLDRLGRHTLHEQRYAGPRAISRFESDAGPTDSALQLVESIESVSSAPLERESEAEAGRSGPAPAEHRGPAESFPHAPDAAPAPQVEHFFTEMPMPAAGTTDAPRPQQSADTVETVLQREFSETRTEITTLRDVRAAYEAPDADDDADHAADLELPDTAVLSREFESFEARLRSLESAPVVQALPAQPRALPSLAVVAPAVPEAGLPATAAHHVEVLIDSIVVNAIAPGQANGKTPAKRDPAEGLALFQQRRKR